MPSPSSPSSSGASHAPPTLHRWPRGSLSCGLRFQLRRQPGAGVAKRDGGGIPHLPFGVQGRPQLQLSQLPREGVSLPRAPRRTTRRTGVCGARGPRPRQRREAERAGRSEKGPLPSPNEKTGSAQAPEGNQQSVLTHRRFIWIAWFLFPSEILHPFRFLFSLLPTWVYFLNCLSSLLMNTTALISSNKQNPT